MTEPKQWPTRFTCSACEENFTSDEHDENEDLPVSENMSGLCEECFEDGAWRSIHGGNTWFDR